DPRTRVLTDLLDEPDRLVVLDGEADWTVLDAAHPLLRLALRATAPVRLDLDVVVPARPVVGLLDELARGVTVGITTRRHAGTFLDGEARPAPRQLLRRMVLVNARPAAELAALATDRTDA
ncbi:MAG TPA: hypothetical protein VHH15_06630, partial [Actinophytocola sp.]|nr:hypothetical protein [Actinophytocola sp.]